MPRPRKPKAVALLEGRDIVHPERHKNRYEPSAAPLGTPPKWMTAKQVSAWKTFEAEMPWLNYSHRALCEVACVVRARLASGDEVGVQAMSLMRLCLSSMGGTPVDASKIAWKPDEDDHDDILDS